MSKNDIFKCFLKTAILINLFIGFTTVYANGFTNWAVPTQITLTNDGIKIFGAFSDVNSCGRGDSVIVRGDTNQLALVKSLAIAALTAGKPMQFYIIGCDSSYNGETLNMVYQSRYTSIRNQ